MFYIQDCTRPQFSTPLSFSAAHVRNPLCVIKLPNLIPRTRLPSTSTNSARYPTLSSTPTLPPVCPPRASPPPRPPPPPPPPPTVCPLFHSFLYAAVHFFFSPANARFATVHRARLSILVRAFSPSPPPLLRRLKEKGTCRIVSNVYRFPFLSFPFLFYFYFYFLCEPLFAPSRSIHTFLSHFAN